MPSLLDFHPVFVDFLLSFFALMIIPNTTCVLCFVVWSGVYERCSVRRSVVKDGEKEGALLWLQPLE